MSNGADAVDHSLEALIAELSGRGVPSPTPPTDDPAVIAEVEAALSPLRLPAGIRRLWEIVDPGSIGIDFGTDLMRPAACLETWREDTQQNPGVCPRVLFPIGYASHAHLSVELHGPERDDGGPLFAWTYGGSDFKLVFADIADYLDALAEIVREGRFERAGSRLFVEHDSLEVVGGPRPVAHPVLGAITAIAADVDDWPESWLAKSSVGAEQRTPAGADRTIAEVLLESQFGSTDARISGAVTELAGSAGGISVTISDGSGLMRVWCPAATTVLGPRIGDTFEFHITAPPIDVPQSPDYEALRDAPSLDALPVDVDRVVGRLTAATRPVDATARKIVPVR